MSRLHRLSGIRKLRLRSLTLLALSLAAGVDTGVGLIPDSSSPRRSDLETIAARARVLDLNTPYAAAAYDFLPTVLGSASIVALGESVHVTAEFPLARLQMVRFLHERLGFDVLALEGSETQAWLAQEYLYRTSPHTAGRLERAQQMAWFKLWNTSQMRELLSYVDGSQRTAHPLYLASFDVQTGASAEFALTPTVLTALFDRLRSFGPVEDGIRTTDLLSALAPVVQCQIGVSGGLGRAKAVALTAIDSLKRWVEALAPAIARERPVPHVAALRLIPDNLRDHVELCEHSTTWQKTRDELNTDNALALREQVSAARKIMLWAHHSHLFYNTTGGRIPSMGQHLRNRVGREIYTVGLFAGSGRFLDVAPLSVHSLPAMNKVGVERLLGGAGPRPYFVDLSTLPTDDSTAGWLTPTSSRMEGHRTESTVLARDFDGALYVPHVTPGTGMVPDGPFKVLQLFGFAVDYPTSTATGVVLIVVWLTVGVRRRVRRKSTISSSDLNLRT
jgi:erythromycin esterase